MDSAAFDRLTTTFATSGTRRGLTRLLLSVPVLGGLSALLGDETEAGRRRRRRIRHKRRHDTHRRKNKNKHKHKHKRKRRPAACIPESAAQTCAGKCATVTNNCGQAVECGSCVCGTCAVCHTCNTRTGICIPDSTVVGQVCGDGQVCQDDGSCACSGNSCGACRSCQGNDTCSNDCTNTQCCDGTSCQPGTTNGACGTGGTACVPCSGATPVCLNQTCSACTGLRQPCTTPAQCCPADQTTCGLIFAVLGPFCCRPKGGACTSGGIGGDCCFAQVPNGSDPVGCSPSGICGGTGAPCRFNEVCVSGQCNAGVCA